MIRRALRAVRLSAIVLIPVPLLSACSADGGNFSSLQPTAKSRPIVALPPPGGWLDHLNCYRAAARLSPVTENAAWSAADRKHAIYTVKNNALRHSEDPDNSWYTPEGQTAARQSNLFHSSNSEDTDGRAIDAWMQSPFHAVGLLDPRLVQVGFGSYREARGTIQMGAALNVIAGISSTVQARYPVFWPGNDAIIPMSLQSGGSPDPLAGCPGYTTPSGLPLILQVGPGNLTPEVSATSFTQNGQPLEHCVFDETTYRDPDREQQLLGRSILGARDAIVLIPRFPLATGTIYTASVTVNGRRHTWSFSTGSSRAQGQEHQNFSD